MTQEFAIARMMLRLGNRLVNIRSMDVQELELSPVQAEALHYFHNHPGGNAAGLRNHLQVSHQAARALVERMKAKSFLEVANSDSDGRSRAIFLAPRGEKAYASIVEYGSRAGQNLLVGFSEEEKAQLESLLKRLLSFVE